MPRLSFHPRTWSLRTWLLLLLAGSASAWLVFHTFRRWDHATRSALLLGFYFSLIALAVTSTGFLKRFVPPATANHLAFVRILTCGVLLWNTVWEGFASSALLPRSMVRPHILGMLEPLYALPGFQEFITNEGAMQAAVWITEALLFCGLIGFGTRLAIPLAAVGYLVLAGINRHYCWFYHTGLIPWYVLAVLAFCPAGHGWSVDRWLRERGGKKAPPASTPQVGYSWARYACWVAVAVPYVLAGLSKLRNGGWHWWHPTNLRSIIYRDGLNPMEFEFSYWQWLIGAPDIILIIIGVSTILGEAGFVLVLFSALARLLLTTLMLSMHAGIWLLQGVLFFDLFFMLLIFYDPVEIRALRSRWLGGRAPAPARLPASSAQGRAAPLAVSALAALMAWTWTHKLEYFPLTSMQMYSQRNVTGELKDRYYYKAFATRASGEVTRAPLEHAIHAMADSRYRRALSLCFKPKEKDACRDYFLAAGAAYNRKAAPQERIVQFEIQQWEWNFLKAADDPDHGDLIERFVLDIPPSS
jgi:hypothetical protein